MKIFFNSSLPRSGSTLLQNILAQNPNVHATGTSGVIELLYAARKNFTELPEFKLDGDQEQMTKAWLGFCRSALAGWYANITDKPCVSEKSRGWLYYYPWISSFWPNPKMIVCVRDLRSIIASMEKLHRKNMHLHDPADKPAEMGMVTIESRIKHWLNTAPVGLGILRLRDAMLKGNLAKCHVVVYEKLMTAPGYEMARLYQYLEESAFTHDFQKIEQLVSENDAIHGTYGSHIIRPSLSPPKEDWNEVLGEDIAEAIVLNHTWFYKTFYRDA